MIRLRWKESYLVFLFLWIYFCCKFSKLLLSTRMKAIHQRWLIRAQTLLRYLYALCTLWQADKWVYSPNRLFSVASMRIPLKFLKGFYLVSWESRKTFFDRLRNVNKRINMFGAQLIFLHSGNMVILSVNRLLEDSGLRSKDKCFLDLCGSKSNLHWCK